MGNVLRQRPSLELKRTQPRQSSFPRSIRKTTVKAMATPRATDLGFCLAKLAAVLVAPRRISWPFFSLSRNVPFISPIDDSTRELSSRISGLADRPNFERSSSASATKSLMALKLFITFPAFPALLRLVNGPSMPRLPRMASGTAPHLVSVIGGQDGSSVPSSGIGRSARLRGAHTNPSTGFC